MTFLLPFKTSSLRQSLALDDIVVVVVVVTVVDVAVDVGVVIVEKGYKLVEDAPNLLEMLTRKEDRSCFTFQSRSKQFLRHSIH